MEIIGNRRTNYYYIIAQVAPKPVQQSTQQAPKAYCALYILWLKAKNKLSDDEDVISQADHDLEQVMGLETYKDPPKAGSLNFRK